MELMHMTFALQSMYEQPSVCDRVVHAATCRASSPVCIVKEYTCRHLSLYLVEFEKKIKQSIRFWQNHNFTSVAYSMDKKAYIRLTRTRHHKLVLSALSQIWLQWKKKNVQHSGHVFQKINADPVLCNLQEENTFDIYYQKTRQWLFLPCIKQHHGTGTNHLTPVWKAKPLAVFQR